VCSTCVTSTNGASAGGTWDFVLDIDAFLNICESCIDDCGRDVLNELRTQLTKPQHNCQCCNTTASPTPQQMKKPQLYGNEPDGMLTMKQSNYYCKPIHYRMWKGMK
jgi:hypothetical protein